MKRIPYLILAAGLATLALGFCPAASAQLSTGDGGWAWLDPLPQGNRLEAVSFIDSLHAVAAGDSGAVLTSSDGGATWVSHDLHIAGAHVADLSFVDAVRGWAVVWVQPKNGGNDRHLIMQTENGGATWAIRGSFPLNKAVDFVNASHGWVCGLSTVWSTRNGGRTWTAKDLRHNWYLDDIVFTDASHGWAVGYRETDHGAHDYPIVVATSDGGVSWHAQHLPAGEGELSSVSFADAEQGWVVGHGLGDNGGSIVLATTDGGATWSPQSAGTDEWLSSVTFVDRGHGWLTGGGKVLATTDGGSDWTANAPGIGAVAVSFSDDLNGVCVGSLGGIATSDDGGAVWQVRGSVSPAAGFPMLADITFADGSHGWAVGSDAILATTDGGATWESQTSGADLKRVSFIDPTHGWAVGADGPADRRPVILHTSDGGLSWQLQHAGKDGSGGFRGYTSVAFIDGQHGWVTGSSATFPVRTAHPTVGRTTDGGVNWKVLQLRRIHNVASAVSFVDARHGWIVCAPYDDDHSGSKILRTMDGGLSWRSQYTTKTKVTLRDLTFVDRRHGWAVGSRRQSPKGSCLVLTTTDGGRTWSRRDLTSYDPHDGSRVVFADARHGWIACGPTVLATTDGGRHWRTQRPGSIVHALSFTDATHGWALAEGGDWVFDGGGVLTTTTGGRTP